MSARTRERIVAAAAELAADEGWTQVTMAKLARTAGVSRQTVYNEMGSKTELAQAVVLREVAAFLALVDEAFVAHPTDVVAAVEGAAYAVLSEAPRNKLVQAILSGAQGTGAELLPLLTTRSDALVDLASQAVAARLLTYDLALTAGELRPAVDALVRLMLSHVTHPGAAPEAVARDVAWVAHRLLDTRG